MANLLILNQPQVWNGLGTLTFTIPTTGNYSVQVQSSFPSAAPINSVPSGTGIGASITPAVPLGAGSGMGLGSGTGGGGTGFTDGDQGTGHGGTGQGFGTGNSYQQPSSQASNATASSPTTSQLSIVVNQNGVAGYTATTPALIQSALQFKYSFLATAADTITVVLSSSLSSDNQLSGVKSIVTIQQGF